MLSAVVRSAVTQGIVASLRDHGLTPDKFTYAALLHCCSTAIDDDLQGKRATQVLNSTKNEAAVAEQRGVRACICCCMVTV